MSRTVEFYRHSLGKAELASLEKTFNSLFLTLGPRVQEFEGEFAAFMDAPHAVGVSSCSLALILTLRALGVGRGDEVITSPMTFIATSNAALHLGAKPVFVDIDPSTGLIDAGLVEASITPKTRAIVAVHLYGQLAPVRELRKIADRHGVALVEDAAHAIESEQNGEKSGAVGDAAVFSFYATKTMTSGDGGAVVTRNPELASAIRQLRNHGVTKDAVTRHGEVYRHWDMETLGYKAALTDVEAALLLPQLPQLQERRAKREERVEAYRHLLASHEAIRLVDLVPGVSSHHLFTVRVASSLRDDVLSILGERGVGCAVNYRAVNGLRYYRGLGYDPASTPHAYAFGEQTISLPLWPDLPLDDVEWVCEQLDAAIELASDRRER